MSFKISTLILALVVMFLGVNLAKVEGVMLEESCVPEKPVVPNAHVYLDTITNLHAWVNCNDGFIMHNADPLTMVECRNGTWHNVPVCRDPKAPCFPEKPDVPNAQVYLHHSKIKAVINCNSGFVLDGRDPLTIVQCQNKTWQNVPKCRANHNKFQQIENDTY